MGLPFFVFKRFIMKKLLISFILALSSMSAQSVSIVMPTNWILHPIKAFKSVPTDKKFLLLTDSILQDINLGDYLTTKRGVFPGGYGYCELNPLFTSAPCQINVPRFTGVKIAVAAVGVAEWIPIWLGKGSPNYMATMDIINVSAAVPLGIAVVNNIVVLEKGR